MSQTTMISRYVVERKDDIQALQRFCAEESFTSTANHKKRKFTVDGLRFRTRSYRPYRMSNSMKAKVAKRKVLLKLD